jgi:hypothetical protein
MVSPSGLSSLLFVNKDLINAGRTMSRVGAQLVNDFSGMEK